MTNDKHEQLAEKRRSIGKSERNVFVYKPLVNSHNTLCNTLAAVNGCFNSCTSCRNESGDIYSLEVEVDLRIEIIVRTRSDAF